MDFTAEQEHHEVGTQLLLRPRNGTGTVPAGHRRAQLLLRHSYHNRNHSRVANKYLWHDFRRRRNLGSLYRNIRDYPSWSLLLVSLFRLHCNQTIHGQREEKIWRQLHLAVLLQSRQVDELGGRLHRRHQLADEWWLKARCHRCLSHEPWLVFNRNYPTKKTRRNMSKEWNRMWQQTFDSNYLWHVVMRMNGLAFSVENTSSVLINSDATLHGHAFTLTKWESIVQQGSISSTFYAQLLCIQSCASKIQT